MKKILIGSVTRAGAMINVTMNEHGDHKELSSLWGFDDNGLIVSHNATLERLIEFDLVDQFAEIASRYIGHADSRDGYDVYLDSEGNVTDHLHTSFDISSFIAS